MHLSSKSYSILFFFALAVLTSCQKGANKPGTVTDSTVTDKGWQFETAPVWEDDFNGTSLDTTKWSNEVGSDYSVGELQYNTAGNHNATVQNGILTIEGRKEDYNGKNYTSARLISRGKSDFLYGRFEISAKFPKGKGPWSIIHLLPTESKYGSWPASGEIDMMDYIGYDTNNVHSSVATTAYHTGSDVKKAVINVPGATDTFHVYRLDWTPFAIRGYVDGTKYFEFTNDSKGSATWPFDQKFFLVLNEVIGGSWGGLGGIDDKILPAQLQIDYIKVYKIIDK